jgi:poly(3-hydroxybutyrate) depolymerase
MAISQWNLVADENGFIVVYPEGTGDKLEASGHRPRSAGLNRSVFTRRVEFPFCP